MILTPHLKGVRGNENFKITNLSETLLGFFLPNVTLTLFQGTYIYRFHCVPPFTTAPVHSTVPQHEEATNSQR